MEIVVGKSNMADNNSYLGSIKGVGVRVYGIQLEVNSCTPLIGPG